MASRRPTGDLIEMLEKQAKEIRKLKKRRPNLAIAGRVSRSSNQTLTANSTNQLITWNRTDLAFGGVGVELGNGKLIVPQNGAYLLTAGIVITTTAPGNNAFAEIRINGTNDTIPILRKNSWNTGDSETFGDIYALNVDDEITLEFNPQGTAAVLRGHSATSVSTSLSIAKV